MRFLSIPQRLQLSFKRLKAIRSMINVKNRLYYFLGKNDKK